MKRSLVIVLMLAWGFVLSAAAQTSTAPEAPAGPAKVAVISFQTAVGQTNEFQRNFADLEKKYEPKRQQLKALSDEIDSLDKQLNAESSKLSAAERSHRAKAIDEKKKQAQRIAEDAQTAFSGDMQEIFKGVAGKVYDVLSSYAQQHGYTLVLDESESRQQAPEVLYATQDTDITKAVIEAYNLKSGIPAPPPPAAAPKPAAKPPVTH